MLIIFRPYTDLFKGLKSRSDRGANRMLVVGWLYHQWTGDVVAANAIVDNAIRHEMLTETVDPISGVKRVHLSRAYDAIPAERVSWTNLSMPIDREGWANPMPFYPFVAREVLLAEPPQRKHAKPPEDKPPRIEWVRAGVQPPEDNTYSRLMGLRFEDMEDL